MPVWVVFAGIALVVAGYFFFFVYFFISPYSFRWQAIIGDPVYPDGFDIHGIDISHYQERIDWERLRNAQIKETPLRFVFIKATEGSSLIDENFNENFYQAKQNGLIRGAYHFFTPDVDARLQADFFLRQVHLEAGDLPPVLDIEKAGSLSSAQLKEQTLLWLRRVENHYGVKPIIYTGYKFKMKYLNDSIFNQYPYWIAHYYVDHLTYQGKWEFWQYTDVGRVDGIRGFVDCNIYKGNLEQLMHLTIKQEQLDQMGMKE